ncbi:MAG TPA: thioredoxin-dependent thiol peroxidase [Pyrinomonadaceae bacterium]
MLMEGDAAPVFTAKNQNGESVNSADFRGRRVVLYFYPKDDTPGCTKQACSLRDSFDVFREKGIKVFGVSTDSEESHRKFISKYALPFDLLADTEKEIVNAYGVYGEKNNYGKKYMGVNRTTFLIDENGKIVKIFKKVKVEEHASEVLEAFGENKS